MYQNLNAKLYAEVKLPFGIEYTLNFTPYYSWHDYYNHYSSEGEKWEAIGGASVRTNTKQFSWQIDNIIRWKREFAQKHKVEVTLLANAEKLSIGPLRQRLKGIRLMMFWDIISCNRDQYKKYQVTIRIKQGML